MPREDTITASAAPSQAAPGTSAGGSMRPHEERVAETAAATLWVGRILVWLVYAFATIASVLLLIAFFLQLTGANPAAPFAAWVYRSSDVLLQPFRSLYPTERLHTGRSELNLSIVFAIFMYGLFAVLFSAALAHFDRWIWSLRLGSRAEPLNR